METAVAPHQPFCEVAGRLCDRIDLRFRFEQAVSDRLSHFVGLPAPVVDGATERAQGRVCENPGIELQAPRPWAREDPRQMAVAHLHPVPGGPARPIRIAVSEVRREAGRDATMVVDAGRSRPERLGPARGRRSGVVRRRRFAWHAGVALLVASGLLAGCSTFMSVTGQQQQAADKAALLGTISTEAGARGPLYVGLVARTGTEYRLVDYFVAPVPGEWAFAVEPGTYWMAAFEDVDGDGRYDEEPALRIDPDQPIVLAPGERRRDVALRIPAAGRFDLTFTLPDLIVRTADDQKGESLTALGVAGQVTSLDDPRFSREKASEGMWRYYDFIYDVRPGVYFLEEYDPAKIPVLFVHGIGGTPLDFAAIIGALDRTRFQPWVFYYPSGGQLDRVAAFLTQLTVRLRTQHRFKRMAVVAHSMGGLVTREFLLQDFEKNGTSSVALYATISSPLGGLPSAGTGVRMSPVVVHSWRDLAPGSAFLDGLYFRDVPKNTERRRLPVHTDYHMLFGYKGDSGDGVVPIASQLRAEAQDEAQSIRGFQEDHTSILQSPEAIAHLNAILRSL